MGRFSSNLAEKGSEENSLSVKNLSKREVFSQLQESIRQVIVLSGLAKGEIASALNVAPSTVSSWLDRTGMNARKISLENAKVVLRMVRPRPLRLLEGIERAEELLEKFIRMNIGPSDPLRY